jgi:hypothetical protein
MLCENKDNETYFGQNSDDCGDECEVMCGFASLANSRRVLGLTPTTPRALWEQARAAGLIPTPFLGLGPKELCDVAGESSGRLEAFSSGEMDSG